MTSFGIYKSLKKDFDTISTNEVNTKSLFLPILKSAFTKCYEFNLIYSNRRKNEKSFYHTPVLRGVCEDLIVLKFLKLHSTWNKELILNAYLNYELIDNLISQDKFFRKNRPHQIIFNPPDKELKRSEFEKKLNDIWQSYGLNKEKVFPKISHMACDSGLRELYDYLYHATSSMVHFSPHILLRSGWTNDRISNLYTFNPKNFYKYYQLFNEFFGSYLFVLFSNVFHKELNLSKEFKIKVKDINQYIDEQHRWPELITLEEINTPSEEVKKIRFINSLRTILIKSKTPRPTSH